MNVETAEQIEMKLAFLERAQQELSDVVYRQQGEIRALQDLHTELLQRLDRLSSANSPDALGDSADI